ncbi:MAG: hypothetical protein ACYSTR_03080 [Planctomycetota bacterium]|jgi:hypothetical protein
MKNKNILLMLENHIDKIVLAVFVLVSLFLLWVYVIDPPYGKPSEIDIHNKQEADKILPGLDDPPPPTPPLKPYLSDYEQLLQCSISEVATIQIPSPGVGDVVVEEGRIYALPGIPALVDVAVNNLRGAARVPTEEIAPNRPYASAIGEIKDVDFVSVSARFDVQKLYNNFQQSFMGRQLQKTSWKNEKLATPVFSRLELQRRTKQNDGRWGSWASVPRTMIDSYHKLLEELPLTLDQSQYGVDIWLSRYEKQAVQHNILQPEYYSFTVSQLEWMPPEYLDQALDILKKEEEKEKRERQEQLHDRRTKTPDNRRTNPATRRTTAPRRQQPVQRGRRPGGDPFSPNMSAPALRKPVRKERTVKDVQKDFEKQLLDDKSNIATMQDPLLVWAHDDTTEPGQTYQYRLRMGVFNPIAGKEWFQKDQVEYKDQIVLWSGFSEPTEELHVPKRIYVFPMEVIANENASNGTEGVKVEVAKYYIGQWRDYEFDVYHGEIIGYEVEDVEEKSRTQYQENQFEPVMTETGMVQEPDTVDFTTDITFVDVIRDTVWGSRLRPSVLYKMLYYDEGTLQQMPVGKSRWSSETRGIYADIQESIERGVRRRSPGIEPGMIPGVRPTPVRRRGPTEFMDPVMRKRQMQDF